MKLENGADQRQSSCVIRRHDIYGLIFPAMNDVVRDFDWKSREQHAESGARAMTPRDKMSQTATFISNR